jgi:DNA polymerase III subunit delta
MKLDRRAVPAFLRDPGACRVVLLHGDDDGLIRHYAATLVRSVAGTPPGSPSDPFRVAELDGPARLEEEASALSLSGGRRVVRLREATDAAAGPVRAILDRPAGATRDIRETLVVLEAAALSARSKLRSLVELAPNAAAIGCYPDEGKGLQQMIRETLGAAGIVAERDAVEWLGSQLGADRGTTLQELEKLVVFVGRERRLDLTQATACVGDVAGLSLEDALFAMSEGDVTAADRALDRAMLEGTAPVGVLRAALMHLQRLHRMRLAVERGVSIAEAVRSARPPLFYRRTEAAGRALASWRADSLLAALERLSEAERDCKRTGAPADAICQQLLLALAREAGVSRAPVRR